MPAEGGLLSLFMLMQEIQLCTKIHGRKPQQMIKQIFLILAILTVIEGLSVTETKISASRNTLRSSVCAYYNTTFSEAQRAAALPIARMYNYLGEDPIKQMMAKRNLAVLSDQTYLIVVAHVVALGALVVMLPGLVCCCTRPDKYPICRKLRKPDGEMYTRSQLKCPAALATVLFIVLVGAAAAALNSGPDITNHVNNVACKLLSVADDTLYGRMSSSSGQKFFVGIAPLKAELVSFNSKLATFFSQSNTSLNASADVRAQQAIVESDIAAQYSAYTAPVYANAFRSDATTYVSVNSQFKTLFYGPISDSSKILGNINNKLASLFAQVNTAVDPLIAAWTYLEAKGQTAVSSYMTGTIASISAYEAQLNATIESYRPLDNQGGYSTLNIIIKLIYGLVLTMGLLGAVSSFILTVFTVVRIRLIIYFACSFLVALAAITFCFLVFMGVLMPNVGQLCTYADQKLTSQEGITDLFTTLQFNTSASLFSKCSTSLGSGKIIQDISPGFSDSFDNMNLIASYSLKFNDLIPRFAATNFDAPFSQATVVLNTVKQARTFEFTNPAALNFLTAVANKLFTIDASCTSSNVMGDSWVPSRSVVSCQQGLFARPPCTDLSSITTCQLGCYEMYNQLSNTAGDPTNYAANLRARYGSTCPYAQFIIDLHQQWTQVKVADINTRQTNLNAIKAKVATYQSKVNTIQSGLNTFKSNLIQNFNSETNATSGSFNGVDCRIIGESIQQLRDAVCVGLLSSIQYNFIMLSIISYTVMLLACASVCAGVRHYLHLQKMQVSVGYKGVPVTISSNRLDDKFGD